MSFRIAETKASYCPASRDAGARLHAIFTAQLSDGAGRETPSALAHEQGHADLVASFSDALLQEHKHQTMIQTWYEEAVVLWDAADAAALHGASGTAAPASGVGRRASMATMRPRHPMCAALSHAVLPWPR
jgi:hypothetical protein